MRDREPWFHALRQRVRESIAWPMARLSWRLGLERLGDHFEDVAWTGKPWLRPAPEAAPEIWSDPALSRAFGGASGEGNEPASGAADGSVTSSKLKQGPFPGQAASVAPGITDGEHRTGEPSGQGQGRLAAERNASASPPKARNSHSETDA